MTKEQKIGWTFLAMLPVAVAIGWWFGSRVGDSWDAVHEVETARLVCAVSRAGIACVPNIPGLFEEGSP